MSDSCPSKLKWTLRENERVLKVSVNSSVKGPKVHEL